ncbi:MAG: non-canonical purine NTP diphosphatase [Tannerellaceae bacterium]|jgi:XTP/dITP diphosphohydrolase|nr:non-canonical purine NTP diphosphatase [Tannerellaceae bacterium]
MKSFVFATNNPHKLEEIKSIVSGDIRITSLAEIDCREDIPETADSLEGNALLKARYIKEHYGYNCFADDTGLEVEALGNAPGIFSARYAGPEQDSQANLRKLLHEMEKIDKRKARFRTVIALIIDDKEYTFEGIIKGQITREERGLAGFGYDPIFVPEGYEQTFAELGNEIKNAISHRALAAKQLAKFLSSLTPKI